jgi:hypothetical protein
MSIERSAAARRFSRAAIGALLLALFGLGQPAAGRAAPAATAPPPGMARIWVYRDYAPYDSLARPYVRINGRIAGISEPGGAFYRDVPPGQYDVTVDSDGFDVDQFPRVAVVAGQQVFLKVSDDRFWYSGRNWARDTFYVREQLPQIAGPEIARMPLYDGG